jgi:hypothetical protein
MFLGQRGLPLGRGRAAGLVLIAVGIVGTYVIVPNELLVAGPVAVTDGGSPLGDDHEIGADLRFL